MTLRKPKPASVPSPARIEDPLLARPRVAEHVETRFDSRGLAQIRREPPPPDGVWAWLGQRLGFTRAQRVDLDERGTWFWRRIDGRRTLEDIATDLRRETNQPETEARDATILFTKMLMRRGLIALDLSYRQPRKK